MLEVLFCVFSVLFSRLSQINAEEDSKLLFVQILFRHGDRTPLKIYPNDPNPENVWAEGLGQLTNLGKKQHYALGKFLRKMYANFTTSSPYEVRVNSTDVDRVLMSAEANLASFLAPGDSKWRFDDDIDWQPVRISYSPEEQDMILGMQSDCPRAFEEQKHVQNSVSSQKLLSTHKEMFQNLTESNGFPVTNWNDAYDLYDTLFIEKKYHLQIPSWVDPYWDELRQVAEQSFYWNYNSPVLHRLRAGPLLKRMIHLMDSKLEGEIPLQKFQIYSAHDDNIVMLLAALKLSDMNTPPPPYCATVLLELHELAGGEKAVRLLYLNSTNPENGTQVPHVLTLKGCTEFCSLSYFKEFTERLIPDDWKEECELSSSFSSFAESHLEELRMGILRKHRMKTDLVEKLVVSKSSQNQF